MLAQYWPGFKFTDEGFDDFCGNTMIKITLLWILQAVDTNDDDEDQLEY